MGVGANHTKNGSFMVAILLVGFISGTFLQGSIDGRRDAELAAKIDKTNADILAVFRSRHAQVDARIDDVVRRIDAALLRSAEDREEIKGAVGLAMTRLALMEGRMIQNR